MIRLGMIIALFPVMFSCNNMPGIDITDREEMGHFQERVKDYISPDIQITEISFFYRDEMLPDIMRSLIIWYISPDDESKQRVLNIDLSSNGLNGSWSVVSDEESGPGTRILSRIRKSGENIPVASIDDFDFTAVPSLIAQAIEQMESMDYEYAGTEQVILKSGNDPTQPVYQLLLRGKPTGAPEATKGKKPAVYYNDISFTINAEGEWKIEVDDRLKIKRGRI